MKLDNRGWGLREMLIYSSILLIFLLIAAFRISVLYNDVNSDGAATNSISETSKNVVEDGKNVKDTYDLQYYYKYEDEMIEATRKYLKIIDYDIVDNSDGLKIDLLILTNLDLIEPLYDKNSDAMCEGYTMVTVIDGKQAIKSYLLCRDYVTKGY